MTPPKIDRLDPADGFDPSPLGFATTVVAPPAAQMVYVAGKLADAHDADFDTQVDQAFENLRRGLELGGATLSTVVRITCLVVDADDDRIAKVGAARREHFGNHRPASTLIPVPRLVSIDALFEIDAIAVRMPSDAD